MLKYSVHLVAAHAFKPDQKIVYLGSGFEILEERLDWHAGSAKDPSSARLVGRTLHRRAIFPIEHA